MKRLKKILALALAMAMVLGMTSIAAFAASPTNNLTVDSGISVTNLEEGDVVKYYKIVQWNENTGWGFTEDFESLATDGLKDGVVIGATPAEATIRDGYAASVLKYITGLPAKITEYNTDGTVKTKEDAVPGRINSALAGKIAEIAYSKTGATGGTLAADGDSYKWSLETGTNDAGLYLALVTPVEAGVVYNPIFVAADYTAENKTGVVGDVDQANTFAAKLTDSYSDKAVPKKTKITVDKTADDEDGDTVVSAYTDLAGTNGDASVNQASTADIGEAVKFVVNVTIPEYADNYTDILFSIQDTLSTGLVMNKTKGFTVETKLSGTNTYADVTGSTIYKSGKAPSDVKNNDSSYDITFTHDYLHGLEGATDVRITYWATITEDIGLETVNNANNTVTIKYSNDPTNKDNYGVLKDVTNHYTFSIDADLFGLDEYESSEVVKIGVDKDGNILTTTKTLDNGTTTSPLEGAEFKLYKKSSEDGHTYTDADLATTKNKDGSVKFNGKIKTDANGKIKDENGNTVGGLDVGEYVLIETKAPAGYIADTTEHNIKITAKFEEKDVEETINSKTVTYKTQVLKEYTIDVDGTKSTYTITNTANTTPTETNTSLHMTNSSSHKTGDTTFNEASDNSHFITNTQGVALPSTGGIGTTIFYVVGAILVIGAGVVLITKRRMDA